MVKIVAQITINKPVDKIFARLSDFRTMTQYGSGVSLVAHVGGPKKGLGAKYRTYGKILGRNTNSEIEVISYEPPHAITTRGTFGHISFEDRLTLKSVKGATQLTLTDTSHPFGLFKAFSFIYKPVVAWYMSRDLNRIKKFLES